MYAVQALSFAILPRESAIVALASVAKDHYRDLNPSRRRLAALLKQSAAEIP